MMKKLFVLLIKYMPTIQLVGMLVNNTLYKYDVNLEFDYIGDFLLGNSIANITILYVCSYTEEELNEIIDDLTKLNRGIKRISKTYACEKILHCSPSTFDTYVKLGIIPPGHKEVGFKELSWSEKYFDEATLNKVRKYSSKKGL